MYVDYVMEESFGKQNARQMIGGFSARTENSKNNYQKIGGGGMIRQIIHPKRETRFFSSYLQKTKLELLIILALLPMWIWKKGLFTR